MSKKESLVLTTHMAGIRCNCIVVLIRRRSNQDDTKTAMPDIVSCLLVGKHPEARTAADFFQRPRSMSRELGEDIVLTHLE